MADNLESAESDLPMTETPDMESAEGTTDAGSRRALRKRSLFIGAFLVFGFFIALNAPYPYHTFTSAGGTPDTDFDFKINAALGQVTEAGWPLRYYIRHDFVDNTASTHWTSTAALMDLAVAVVPDRRYLSS